jgi:6-hydroxycyclohex-1-ene-1-carbonyl-CoA dehydrogenase
VAKEHGARAEAWRLFETSGSKGGQELAWSLLNPGATLSVVGFTPEPVSVRLSNLMAFDASAYGNWGCDPALYPEALALVSRGAVRIRGLVKSEKLSDAPQVLEAVHHHQYSERVVLVP